VDAACRLFPPKSACHKYRSWVCLGVGVGVENATEREWIFPVAEKSSVGIDGDAFFCENFPVGHRVVKSGALASLNFFHLVIHWKVRVVDNVSPFVFAPAVEVKFVFGVKNRLPVGGKHFFWVEHFCVGVGHFVGQFVLVMCDIQKQTKYFNFFLIGSFELLKCVFGAKVADLISGQFVRGFLPKKRRLVFAVLFSGFFLVFLVFYFFGATVRQMMINIIIKYQTAKMRRNEIPVGILGIGIGRSISFAIGCPFFFH